MKYKIVGYIDIILSFLFGVSQVLLLIFVYPKMLRLYSDLNVQLPPATKNVFPIGLMFTVIYLCIFLIGLKLLKKPDRLTFILGIIAALIMILFGGYFSAISVMSVIGPAYNMTAEI